MLHLFLHSCILFHFFFFVFFFSVISDGLVSCGPYIADLQERHAGRSFWGGLRGAQKPLQRSFSRLMKLKSVSPFKGNYVGTSRD